VDEAESTPLRSTSADGAGVGCEFSKPHYLLPVCQNVYDPLMDRGGYREQG